MIELIGYDANNTDGTDLSLMLAIYRIAGRTIKVPATFTQQQVKDYVIAQYGITAAEYDALANLDTALAALDFTTITGLTDTSTTPELVAAIQTLAQAVRALVRQTRLMIKAGNQ